MYTKTYGKIYSFHLFIFLFSADVLGKLTHIRLDRLQITRIENLECLGPVTNLYLQQVHIFLFNIIFYCTACTYVIKWSFL